MSLLKDGSQRPVLSVWAPSAASADKAGHSPVSKAGKHLLLLFALSLLDLLPKRLVIVICKNRWSALKKSPI